MSVCLLTTTGDTDEGGCVQLTTDAWHTRWKRMCTGAGDPSSESWRAAPAFEPADLLPSSLPPSCTVFLSPWLQLDAHDAGVRYDTEIALRQEVAHCTCLNLTSAILPVPHLAHTPSYARATYAALSSSSLLHLAVHLLIYFPSSSFHALWETWDSIRTLCEYHPRLSLATPPLPTLLPPITEAYAAEPISHVMISAHSFISNAKGSRPPKDNAVSRTEPVDGGADYFSRYLTGPASITANSSSWCIGKPVRDVETFDSDLKKVMTPKTRFALASSLPVLPVGSSYVVVIEVTGA